MPPRYVYWTILIDGKATAFRARERDELMPTFNQLARKNRDIAMRYFARGKLWDTPEQAEWAAKSLAPAREGRGRDWRPGGEHEDPRARFKKTSPGKSWGADSGRSRPPRASGSDRSGSASSSRTAGSRPPTDRPPSGARFDSSKGRPPRPRDSQPSNSSAWKAGSRPPADRPPSGARFDSATSRPPRPRDGRRSDSSAWKTGSRPPSPKAGEVKDVPKAEPAPNPTRKSWSGGKPRKPR